MSLHIPRRRQAPPTSKRTAAMGALTSMIGGQKSAPAGRSAGRRKSAGGLALLAGLGAAAFKAKGRRTSAQ